MADARVGHYGAVQANWGGLDTLLAIKEKIDVPRHEEDARVLREVKRLRGEQDRPNRS